MKVEYLGYLAKKKLIPYDFGKWENQSLKISRDACVLPNVPSSVASHFLTFLHFFPCSQDPILKIQLATNSQSHDKKRVQNSTLYLKNSGLQTSSNTKKSERRFPTFFEPENFWSKFDVHFESLMIKLHVSNLEA